MALCMLHHTLNPMGHRMKRIEPLVGISISAATLLFSLVYDAETFAVKVTEDNLRAKEDSRHKLVQYISKLEAQAGIPPQTYYRREV